MESDSPLPDFPLPPLPLITDIGLKRLAMTHRSAANLPHIDGPVEAQEPKDYRKLAHFGDSLVGVLASWTIYGLHPDLSAGAATRLKSKLVSRPVLAQLSHRYKIPRQVLASADQRLSILENDDNAAEMFEAYVAAVFLSYLNKKIPDEQTTLAHPRRTSHTRGEVMDFLSDWLTPIFTAIVGWAYTPGDMDEEEIDRLAGGATNTLNQRWQLIFRRIPDYQEKEILPNGSEWSKSTERRKWKVICTATGEKGNQWSQSATRANKQAAKAAAAYLVWKQLQDEGKWDRLRHL